VNGDFPTWRYGPDGQSAVFQSAEDIPEGWEDHPSKIKGASDPSEVGPAPRRPGKAEIMKDLKRGGVPFNPMSPTSELFALLGEHEEKPAEPPKAAAPKQEQPNKEKPKKERSPLAMLRDEYKKLTGKNPSPRLDAEGLREKIAAHKAA
jgi:hypothetical protein